MNILFVPCARRATTLFRHWPGVTLRRLKNTTFTGVFLVILSRFLLSGYYTYALPVKIHGHATDFRCLGVFKTAADRDFFF